MENIAMHSYFPRNTSNHMETKKKVALIFFKQLGIFCVFLNGNAQVERVKKKKKKSTDTHD